jgi:hypothetical protein
LSFSFLVNFLLLSFTSSFVLLSSFFYLHSSFFFLLSSIFFGGGYRFYERTSLTSHQREPVCIQMYISGSTVVRY